MNAPFNNATLTALYQRAAAELVERYPSLVEDEQAFIDTLDGITDAADAIVACVRRAREAEAQVLAIKSMEEALAARRDRFQRQSEAGRAAAQSMMEQMDRRKVEAPDFTVYLKATPPSVVIYDEAALPPEFIRTVTAPDKSLLKAALRNGDVAGAKLSNGGVALAINAR